MSKITWHPARAESEIEDWIARSHQTPVLFFKHSTRCSISATVLNRLERNWHYAGPLAPVYIDLLAFRGVSNHVSARLAVPHESPQAILVHGGGVVGHWSHFEVDAGAIAAGIPKS